MKFVLRRRKPDTPDTFSHIYDLIALAGCGEKLVATIYRHFYPRRWRRSWLVEMEDFYHRSEAQTLKLARQDAEREFCRRYADAPGIEAA